MKSDAKHTLFSRYTEIHDYTQSILEIGDNVEDKGGTNYYFGLMKYENKNYIIAGDDIGFSETDRDNFIFPDRIHTEGRSMNGENGKFNSGGISANIFLSNDFIPHDQLKNKGLYKNNLINKREYPNKCFILSKDPVNDDIYVLDCNWIKYFTEDEHDISWEILDSSKHEEYINIYNKSNDLLSQNLKTRTLFIYPKEYKTESNIVSELEEVKKIYRLYYFPRLTNGFNTFFIKDENIEKLKALDITNELYSKDTINQIKEEDYNGDMSQAYLQTVKNNKNFNIKIKENKKQYEIDIYKNDERDPLCFYKIKKTEYNGKGGPNIKEYNTARNSINNEDFSIDVVFKSPNELIEFDDQMSKLKIDKKEAKVFIRRGTRLIGVPKTVTFITQMTGVLNKHLHFIINFPLNTSINLKLHGNKFLFEYHTLDDGIRDIIKSSVQKCGTIFKKELEAYLKVKNEVNPIEIPEEAAVTDSETEEEKELDDEEEEELATQEEKEEPEAPEEHESPEEHEAPEEHESPEEHKAQEEEEHIVNNSQNPRKDFSVITQRQSLERQPYCPLLGTHNRHFCGINLFDYDHYDNNSNNKEDENCNPISLLAHRIKTKNLAKYQEIINNPEKLKEFRYNYFIDLLNAIKRDDMLDDTDKSNISQIMYQS